MIANTFITLDDAGKKVSAGESTDTYLVSQYEAPSVDRLTEDVIHVAFRIVLADAFPHALGEIGSDLC